SCCASDLSVAESFVSVVDSIMRLGSSNNSHAGASSLSHPIGGLRWLFVRGLPHHEMPGPSTSLTRTKCLQLRHKLCPISVCPISVMSPLSSAHRQHSGRVPMCLIGA